MLRYLRYVILALIGLFLLLLALANRGVVTLWLLPAGMSTALGLGAGWTLPLFVVILGSVALGIGIGFIWEWMREHRIRSNAKQTAKAVTRLERELAVMKDSRTTPPQDEVLAILAAEDKR